MGWDSLKPAGQLPLGAPPTKEEHDLAVAARGRAFTESAIGEAARPRGTVEGSGDGR